jgi:hypothetical protein
MMIGFIEIDEEQGAVNTHRDSYLLDSITVASVRRPFFIGGLMSGIGLTGFTLSFGDLLYAHEIVLTLLIATGCIVVAWQVGQLKLLSRDLRGSELADVIWGRYASLNAVRLSIARAMSARRAGGRS